MKKCPFCAEEIQAEALKCRYCNEFLDPKARPVENDRPWYFKTATVIGAIMALSVLALPLVWFNPYYSRNKKIVITLIVSVATYALWVVTANALKQMQQLYQTIM